MKAILVEKLWKHHIDKELCDKMREGIDNADTEVIKKYAIEILNKCKEFYNEDDIPSDIDELIEEFNGLDETSTEDDIDFELGELYDFCDGYNIFLDL